MWDLKLIFLYNIFYINLYATEVIFIILNSTSAFLFNGLVLSNWVAVYQFFQNTVFFFSLKFCLVIGFLILIRGGTPRYRYDYLTKLGWLKFLSLVIVVFWVSLLFFFIY